MKFKKIVPVLLTGLIASSLIVGCTAKTTTKKTTKVNTAPIISVRPESGAKLIVWDNGGTDQFWAQYVAQQFTEKYHVPVIVKQMDYITSAQAIKNSSAGNSADVFDSSYNQLGGMVNSGTVLQNIFQNEYQQNFINSAVKATFYNDKNGTKMYGYPIDIESYSLLYNKNLTKQAPKTMNDLISQAKKFTELNSNQYGFMFEPTNYYYDQAFFGGYGSYIFGKGNTDPSDIGLNNQGGVKAGTLIQIINKELLPLNKESLTDKIISSLFNNGKVMYRIGNQADIQSAKNSGINVGVAPLPTLDNGKTPIPFFDVKAYYVNAKTIYPKAASLFAKFATSSDMLLKRYEMTGELPTQNSLLNSKEIQSNSFAIANLKEVNAATQMPSVPQTQLAWTAIDNAMTSIWNNKQQPQKVLNDYVSLLKKEIKSQQFDCGCTVPKSSKVVKK